MPTMHCPNCGQQITSELKFCRSCGMRLDSVVKAVNEHLSIEAVSGDSKALAVNWERRMISRVARGLLIGMFVVLVGAAMTKLGKDVWYFDKIGILLALAGLMFVLYSVISPMLGAGGITGRANKNMLAGSEDGLGLKSAESFQPAASVTERTTKDLDKNKTKVLR